MIPGEVVAEVCAALGIDGGDARLVQHAANALYRLPGAGVMLRLSSTPADHLVRVARELAVAGVPVAELVPDVPQPVTAGGWWATAWVLHPALPGRLPATELAGPLAALHAVRVPEALPAWDLAGAIRAFLQPVPHDLVGRLLERCDEIERELATVRWTLPYGTVHGDAHPGNLLRTADGRVLLGDLDTVAWGPREVDLAPAAHGVVRFGRDRGAYDALAERYGFDLLGAPSWPALRRLRDLQLAVYLLPRPPADPVDARELAERLRSVLENDETARWHSYRAFF
ncbi:phosphotransferase enzyme family protein [Paractinoplanes maris]|uniref:phosphotransferase enzyme family protein n=1 Tax=Paractinoplanes maris TaxID=1734446 RepID=UPI0020202BEA|nr:phosphotransferase [Actinoplanes maris]